MSNILMSSSSVYFIHFIYPAYFTFLQLAGHTQTCMWMKMFKHLLQSKQIYIFFHWMTDLFFFFSQKNTTKKGSDLNPRCAVFIQDREFHELLERLNSSFHFPFCQFLLHLLIWVAVFTVFSLNTVFYFLKLEHYLILFPAECCVVKLWIPRTASLTLPSTNWHCSVQLTRPEALFGVWALMFKMKCL